MKLQRTPLSERPFPDYTHSEEMWNMGTHLFGAFCTLVMMYIAVRSALDSGSSLAVVSTVVYMVAILAMFSLSAIYHGLPKGMPKQVMRVVDHCNIFVTIADYPGIAQYVYRLYASRWRSRFHTDHGTEESDERMCAVGYPANAF